MRPYLKKPSDATLDDVLTQAGRSGFTYRETGMTDGPAPGGYIVDRTTTVVGHGDDAFAAAREGLKTWQHFRFGWITPWPGDTPLKPGADVVVLARVSFVYLFNACRVVYAFDEPGPTPRFGFAYGTLAPHAESGEERFEVRHETDGSVVYEITAYSRPGNWLTRLGYPVARVLQRRFARDSTAAMAAYVAAEVDMALSGLST
ncbi:MAG: DUF1990 domain-containing protein [Planctomycetota bacterium]